jgi:hypothetical protein
VHKNQLAADKRYQAKVRKLGLVRVSVLVPNGAAEEIKHIAKTMRGRKHV